MKSRRGNGKISASGGNGLGGGGGGRIGLDVFSRHDEAEILAHGAIVFHLPMIFWLVFVGIVSIINLLIEPTVNNQHLFIILLHYNLCSSRGRDDTSCQ